MKVRRWRRRAPASRTTICSRLNQSLAARCERTPCVARRRPRPRPRRRTRCRPCVPSPPQCIPATLRLSTKRRTCCDGQPGRARRRSGHLSSVLDGSAHGYWEGVHHRRHGVHGDVDAGEACAATMASCQSLRCSGACRGSRRGRASMPVVFLRSRSTRRVEASRRWGSISA